MGALFCIDLAAAVDIDLFEEALELRVGDGVDTDGEVVPHGGEELLRVELAAAVRVVWSRCVSGQVELRTESNRENARAHSARKAP